MTRRPRSDAASRVSINMNTLYGINTVTEALKAGGRTIQWVGVAKERNDIRLKHIIEDCRKTGVQVRVMSRVELDEIAVQRCASGSSRGDLGEAI